MEQIYRLKIVLKHIKPPIWRRLEVRADTTFEGLHHYVQVAMGWEDAHLHQFKVGRQLIGPDDEDYGDALAEHTCRLAQLLREGQKFSYEYDFGDGWDHDIVVEKVVAADPGVDYPRCTAGKRACPPEDCGGAWGYTDLLAILADPTDEEYQERLDWVGGPIDPEAFDLGATDARLRPRTRRRRASR